MLFFYDRTSRLSGISQYKNFIDNESYLSELNRNVKDITNYQLIEVRKAIQRNTSQLQSSINESIKNVCGTVESGFGQIADELYQVKQQLGNINEGISDINWRLNDINESVLELTSLVDLKTDLLIDQQKIANAYLGTISTGVYLSDKERLNIQSNKRGGVFLKTAILEGPKSTFYKKAIIEFENAREAVPTDFNCLKQLGYIYLYCQEINVVKAEGLFRESSEIALAYNYDSPNQNLLNMAASSLFYASICNYILDNLENSIKQIRKAVDIQRDNQKYKFQLAKYLAASGQEIEAAKILKEVINFEKLYSIEILKDQDLITKPSIQEMLERETLNAVKEVDDELSRINAVVFYGSKYWDLFSDIKANFQPKTYINARIAKEKLEL